MVSGLAPGKLVQARNAKTKNLYIRGTYLGIAVDKSCRTNRRPVAQSILKRIQGEIERGEYPPREAAPRANEPTFLSAALAYMEAGRRRRYAAKLIKHFGETPLSEIDQGAIDRAAIELYPGVMPATRNTCVYTPMSAILRHAGVERKLRRPKGAKGRVITDWLRPPDAFGIIAAAEQFDPELAALLMFLLYTGVRLGAALDLRRTDVRLSESAAWVRHQKGQPASDVRLRDDLREALARQLRSHNHERVFRFHQGGHLKHHARQAWLSRHPLPWPPAKEMEAAAIPACMGQLPFIPPHLGNLDAPSRNGFAGVGCNRKLARSA
jgi:integrase